MLLPTGTLALLWVFLHCICAPAFCLSTLVVVCSRFLHTGLPYWNCSDVILDSISPFVLHHMYQMHMKRLSESPTRLLPGACSGGHTIEIILSAHDMMDAKASLQFAG